MAAAEAADSSDVAMSEGALLSGGIDESMAGLRALDVAIRAEARAKARYQPAGCATITRSETVITYVLANCTGPHGLVHVTGTATATFTDAAEGVQIDLTGSGIRINRATLDLHTTGLLTQTAGQLTLTVTTLGNGTGPRGHAFQRSGGYTLVWEPAAGCFALDGQWKLDAGRAERTTVVSGVRRCEGACPAAGGQIVHTGFRGRTVTVGFDGSAAALWTSSTGNRGTVDLACGQDAP
jgi:hypothetical protein